MSIRLSFVFGFAVAAPLLQANPVDDAYIRQKLIEAIKPDATPTPALPEGDRHVHDLKQEFNDLLYSCTLLKDSINDDRPNEHVLRAANVLADNYEWLLSHMVQFTFWAKSWKENGSKTADFSTTAQQQFTDLFESFGTIGTNNFQECGKALASKPRYANDPDMKAVAQRMLASLNTLTTLKAQADKQ